MQLVFRGFLERRVLVNYRVAPGVLERLLPPRTHLRLCRGVGIATVSLVRQSHVRPRFLPAALGLSSDSAVYSICVEGDGGRSSAADLVALRRETSSWFSSRMLHGLYQHARFEVCDDIDHLRVRVTGDDGTPCIALDGMPTPQLPAQSVFRSLAEASAFCGCPVGRPAQTALRLEGPLPACEAKYEPLAISQLQVSFFDNTSLFPPGTAVFDSALVLRHLEHQWCGLPVLSFELAT